MASRLLLHASGHAIRPSYRSAASAKSQTTTISQHIGGLRHVHDHVRRLPHRYVRDYDLLFDQTRRIHVRLLEQHVTLKEGVR